MTHYWKNWLALATSLAVAIISNDAWAVGPFVEDFESEATCSTTCATTCPLTGPMVNVDETLPPTSQANNRDWLVDSGGTTSSNTGPSVDHTLGTSAGRYVVMETSSPCDAQTYGVFLDSPPLDLGGLLAPSVEFWYHMFGGDIGELHVDVLDASGAVIQADVIPPVVGAQGDMWTKSPSIDLTSFVGQGQVVVRIRGQHFGTSFEGDIALDDFEFFDNIPNDVGINAVLAPVDQVCGQAAQDVEVEVRNFGANPQSSIAVQVDITGDITQTFNGTAVGPLEKNEVEVLTFGPIDTFDGANITITATATLAGDQGPSNDTLVTTPTIKATSVAFTPPSAVCPGGTADIAVTVEPDTDYALFDMATMGTQLAQGFTLTTPPVTAQTTYYIERTSLVESNGAADNMVGMGANYPTFSDGLVFDVSQPVILDAVYVYPGSAGDVVVRLLDASDGVVATSTATTIAAADVGNKVRIPLAFNLPVGADFKLDAMGTTATTLFRNNTGAMYPYTSSSIDITGTKNQLTGAYYFFYDWEIIQDLPLCVGERTPVTVDVDANLCSADLSVAITGLANAEPGMTVEYTVTVTNNGPTVASGVSLDLPTPTGATFVSNAGDCTTAYPCDLGNVQSGATLVVTSTYTVDAGFDGTASFTATTTTASPDANPGDESATQDTVVMGMGVGGGGPGVGGGGPGVGGGGPGVGGGATTSSSGAGGSGNTPDDDGGCSCSTPGSPFGDGGPVGWLAAGLALVVLRRRRG